MKLPLVRQATGYTCGVAAMQSILRYYETEGHWVVAIGYDENRMLFMDPSTLGNYTYIPNEEFLDRWHDTDSDNVTQLVHFGIVISKSAPDYNPDAIMRLE